ncbi:MULTISPECIES: DUF5634 family protein [unclassified Cytobacillus]|uniref:DUF5634 family protein n=1 Tax=unclassified Cytobacillus TaxID=2675268 RepID=UPI00203BAC0D|nr:DUF5634 family protein [Cytobacillus sp. AMY 15.2]MCM3090456.1 DUF5634 family protein [Cytobacillus sp. AMY 15.2]
MDFLSREQVIRELQEPFQSYLDKYGIDDIGVYEEEGQDQYYYMGYTLKKAGKTYHVHSPFLKDENGGLTPAGNEWIIESDEPDRADSRGFTSVEQALQEL